MQDNWHIITHYADINKLITIIIPTTLARPRPSRFRTVEQLLELYTVGNCGRQYAGKFKRIKAKGFQYLLYFFFGCSTLDDSGAEEEM